MARLARRMLFVAAFLAVAAGAPPADTATADQGWDLPQLMASLQRVQAATASFVERKYLHILKEPLQSSGRLVYVRPDKLQKDTILPKPERLSIEGDRLTIEQQNGETRRLSLQELPQIRAFVESIRATLAGDLPTLSRFYDVLLQGNPDNWALRLLPKDAKMRESVSVIRIFGGKDAISSIETLEGDGDRTSMTILAETQ